MDLMDIQPIVQSIAEATAAVLKMEVEIANHEFIRIACTGEMQVDLLKKLEGDFVYQSVFKTKRPVIIEKPGYEEICTSCKFFRNCMEMGEISAPIISQGKVVGVIGLLAFTEQQHQQLFENKSGILTFLNKMADLLASKLEQYYMLDNLERHNRKMERMLDLVQDGLLIINQTGKIIEVNNQAKQILKFNELDNIPSHLNRLIQDLIHTDEMTHQTITLHSQPQKKSIVVTKNVLFDHKNAKEILITVQDVEVIQGIADLASEEMKKPFDKIVGSSNQINEVKTFTFKAAQSKSTILLQGESGTGKEIFANAIHYASDRKDKTFVAVNCGAIPENLLESELFGYEQGAFTGANKAGKVGKFELANGGTIFLDEIGEMPLQLQVKLLRVLQENELERVGGSTPISIDVRVIAATNRKLNEMVQEGLFREDLYFRLSVIPIIIPPLRSRKEDILTLCNHFIEQYNGLFNTDIKGFDAEVCELLMQYPWKGNVRELKNFIEYLFNFIDSGYITLKNAENLIRKKLPLIEEKKGENQLFSLEKMEKEQIIKAIEYTKQYELKIEDAAELLGIGRATLFRKLKKYQNDI